MREALEFFEHIPELPEKRFHARQATRAIAYIQLDEANGGIVLNLSEGGLAVRAFASVMEDVLPRIRFQLPGSSDWIEVSAQVAWTDESRKMAGLRFAELPEQARSQILEWCFSQASSGGLGAQAQPAAKTIPTNGNGVPSAAPASSAVSATESDVTSVAEEEKAAAPEPPPNSADLRSEAQHTQIPPDSGIAPTMSAVQPAPATTADVPMPVAEPPRRKHVVSLPRTRTAQPQFLAPEPRTYANRNLVLLALLLALLSLVVGWGAGRGTFSALLLRVYRSTSKEPAKPAQSISAQAPPSSISDAPTDVATAAPNTSPRAKAPAVKYQSYMPPSRPAAAAAAPRVDSAAPTDQPVYSQPGSATALSSPGAQPTAVRPRTTSLASGSAVPGPPAVSGPDSANSVALPVGPSNTNLEPPKPDATSPVQAPTLRQPQLIHTVEPGYPYAAQKSRIQGTVRLRAIIDGSGRVLSVTPLSGPPILFPAALDAVRQWRYKPALLDGRPVQAEADIAVQFHLPSSP